MHSRTLAKNHTTVLITATVFACLTSFVATPMLAQSETAPVFVPASSTVRFDLEGNVAARVTVWYDTPTERTLRILGQTTGPSDGDSAWLHAERWHDVSNQVIGSSASVSGLLEGVATLSGVPLRFALSEEETGFVGVRSGPGCCPVGVVTYDLAIGSSKGIDNVTLELLTDPPAPSLWTFTRNTGYFTLRDFDGTHAAARSLGVGASAAFDASVGFEVTHGLVGFSEYRPPDGGPDVHHFTYSGPDGTAEADDARFHWTAPGTYTFDLAHQVSAGDWPGEVNILYADFPPPTKPPRP